MSPMQELSPLSTTQNQAQSSRLTADGAAGETPESGKQRQRTGLASRLSSFFSSEGNFALALTAGFAIFIIAGVFRHELWRDEGQAWCIALQAQSIPELFYNMRYEMHPALWHLILFTITRFTHNPLSMQLVHAGIISGAVFLFTRYSPFTRVQKILLTLGYFPFYEYGVISRSYSIVMLILFSLCTLWPARSRHYMAMFGLLALLANTNAYGFLLSAPVAATLVVELSLRETQLVKSSRKFLAAGIAVYVLALGLALVQLLLPPDGCSGECNNNPLTLDDSRLTKTLRTVWNSYVPIPDLTTYHTWNTNV